MTTYRPRLPGFTVRERFYDRVLPDDFRPETIVDVGGLYDSASWLRDRFPDARLIATNIMAKHLDSIPDEWADKRLGAAEDISDIHDADLIFLGEVLEHLVYPQEFLAKAVTLLRPGGLILISTPNLATWHNRLLMLFGYSPTNYSMIPGRHLGVPARISRIAGIGYGDHIRLFTYKALVELFDNDPWRLEGITSDPAIESGRSWHRTRNAIGRVMPPSAREAVYLCARLASTDAPAPITSSGWIGGRAPAQEHDTPES